MNEWADKVKDIANKVPGYQGYVDREARRESDRELRTAIAAAFASQVTRITRVQEQMMTRGDFDHLEALDRVITRLQHLADRIRTARYGFSGLFDANRVDETTLERLYAFDSGLTDGVEQMGDAIAQVGQVGEDVGERITQLRDTLDALHAKFDERTALVENFSPSGGSTAQGGGAEQAAQGSGPQEEVPLTPETPVQPSGESTTEETPITRPPTLAAASLVDEAGSTLPARAEPDVNGAVWDEEAGGWDPHATGEATASGAPSEMKTSEATTSSAAAEMKTGRLPASDDQSSPQDVTDGSVGATQASPGTGTIMDDQTASDTFSAPTPGFGSEESATQASPGTGTGLDEGADPGGFGTSAPGFGQEEAGTYSPGGQGSGSAGSGVPSPS